MESTPRPSSPPRGDSSNGQAEQEHNTEQEQTAGQQQAAEQKHQHVVAASYSLLSAQLAFAEAGERDTADRIADMGQVMFGNSFHSISPQSAHANLHYPGPESFSNRVRLLDGRAPTASDDQVRQVKLEEAQDHLIETWKVLLDLNLDGKAGMLFDFAQDIYGEEEWAMALHRFPESRPFEVSLRGWSIDETGARRR